MTAFAGLRGTGDWGTDERPKNFRELILWANPNGRAPLFALMARMKKEMTDDPEFAWWEETQQIMRIRVNNGGGYSTTENTATVDSGALDLVAGDVLMVEKTEDEAYTNELVIVSSVTSDTIIVIKRGIADSTAKPLPDDSWMLKIGNANEEGTGAPSISQRNPTKKNNFTQIFKTAVGETGTTLATRARTGDAWTNDKKRKAFDHSVAMEFAMMFGKAAEDTSGTKPKRYMGGLREFITTNVTIFTTSPTEDTLLNALFPVFDFNAGGAGDERIVFAGNGFLNELNKLARNSSSTRINFNGVIETYGMRLQQWIMPQGTFLIKTHPLMNVHGRFTNSAFVIDPTAIIYRPLRDTKFMDNIQDNDEDSRKGQWITEMGIEVQHEETMAYIGNFII